MASYGGDVEKCILAFELFTIFTEDIIKYISSRDVNKGLHGRVLSNVNNIRA